MSDSRDELLGVVVLGRYRIVMALGRGGMGVVYLGRTEGAAGFSKPVVIKRIIPGMSDNSRTALFVREARILSNLQHPGIVQVLDFGEEDGAYIMVLEYVHGYNLRQWLRVVIRDGGRFPVESAIVILRRVLESLQYAHTLTRSDGTELGIVHRDISLENILLDAQGYVKLADFGIARMAGDASEFQTQDGGFRGKLPCCPPEIYQGDPASPRSDVYAAGVALYHLLSGANPFSGSDVTETVLKVLSHSPPPISTLREDAPEGLDEVLARALDKDPGRRFQSAAEFASALGALRTLPDEQATARLVEDVRRDFAALPRLLHVMPLEKRDLAWREQPVSTEPPPPDHDAGASSGEPRPDQEAMPTKIYDDSVNIWQKHAEEEDGTGKPASAAAPPPDPAPAAIPAARTSHTTWWIGGVAAVAIIASGAALFAVFSARTPQASPKQRFLVVEQTGQSGTASTASAPTPAASDDTPPAASNAPAAAGRTAHARAGSTLAARAGTPAKPGKTDPAALSRSFARRQSQIQSCFQSKAQSVAGQPRITVRFSIDTSGHVKSAQLIPGSLSGTPLGQCILGVARSTSFGPQPQPLTFSIPIVARKR